ncbi:MAG: hypothetical protein QMC94_06005 [Anaerosomatales bacterium]|nr:hypothetical protein [Anaerosomatales bacterium]
MTVALLGVAGCRDDSSHGNGLNPTEPPLAADYPEWTLVRTMGRTSTVLVAGEDAGQVREDAAYVIESPDRVMTIIAWYARSGKRDSVQYEKWVLLDRLYTAQGWQTAAARSLYQQMLSDAPEEVLLGAYEDDESPGVWHVGFYLEREQSGRRTWVRGDHLYTYDVDTGQWSMLEYDSGSDNAWNSTGSVRY